VHKIWQKQSEFNRKFIEDNASLSKKQSYTKDTIVHLEHELHEILDEINWKMHKKTEKEVDVDKVKEEVIDSFKFLLNIAITWGMTPEEFTELFFNKSEFVERRYLMENFLNELSCSSKVCAFDIDGVLAEYPGYWIDWVEKKTNSNFGIGSPRLRERVMRQTILPVQLTMLKHEYRKSGEKRNLPVTEASVADVVNKLHHLHGFDVVAISARPFKTYSRIFDDTLHWLAENKISIDALLFDDEKHVTITKYFPNLKFIVEDDLDNALKIARSGYFVYLYDKYHSVSTLATTTFDLEANKRIKVIHSLEEILKDQETKKC
jgi:dimeric dUTPase (all-alpha-NTP-PPase superfamily)/uncharacterized HAD superfamily protein